MKELDKTYNPSEIEGRIYDKWMEKKYFHAEVNRDKKPFTIVMPPPNITGQLHMGHALDNTMQDILIRYKRMQGYEALWQPGTDHAAIATEVKVIQNLKTKGIEKKESVLQWMRVALRLFRRYLSVCTKKAIFIREAASLTGVLFVRHLFQMPRLSM